MKKVMNASQKHVIGKQRENSGSRKQNGLWTEQTNRKEEKVESRDGHISMKNKIKEENCLVHVEFEASYQKGKKEEGNGGNESHKEYRRSRLQFQEFFHDSVLINYHQTLLIVRCLCGYSVKDWQPLFPATGGCCHENAGLGTPEAHKGYKVKAIKNAIVYVENGIFQKERQCFLEDVQMDTEK